VLPETSKAEDVTDTPGRMDNVEEANVERTMDTAQVYPIQTHNPSTNQASESASSTAGYSQVSDAEESDDDDQQEPGQVILGGAYAQCKAAREAANRG